MDMSVPLTPPTQTLDEFLSGIERRAFLMARIGVGDAEEALDLVQDAMTELARRYANRPSTEWPALFHRILQNGIRLWHRRRQRRQRWLGWLDAEDDVLDRIPDTGLDPEQAAHSADSLGHIETALMQLSIRQRQVFLLRVWEGLDVAATAAAMRISEGSVKTHLSRAMTHLRQQLQELMP